MKLPPLGSSRAFAGQSVAEYALAIALILCAALGALSFLGGQSLQAMAAMGSNLMGRPQGMTPPATNPSGTTTLMLQLSDGSTVTLNQFPVDLTHTVETTGVNGASELLLANLSELTQSLQDVGALTPAQASALTDLANAGHYLTEGETALEAAILAANGNRQIFSSTPIVMGTQTMNGYDSISNLGSTATVEQIALDPLSAANLTLYGPRSANFLGEYYNAQASGALDNPAVNAIVTALSKQILIMADSLQDQAWNLAANPDLPDVQDPKTLHEIAVSGATLAASQGVCETGGGTDNGIRCQ